MPRPTAAEVTALIAGFVLIGVFAYYLHDIMRAIESGVVGLYHIIIAGV